MSDSVDLNQFTFSFDPALDDFDFSEPTSMDEVYGADPGVFLPNVEGRSEFLPPDPDRVPVIPNAVDQSAPEYAARPAQERTRELLAHMSPHRQVLLGVLRAAKEPRSNEQITQAVDDLRTHKFSVYSPSNICTMLEQAGALVRVTAEGAPYADYVPTPLIVEEDGVEFYQPTTPPTVYWRTSEAGLEALVANDPEKRAIHQLEREANLQPLYKRVLTLCARTQGATMSQLSGAVDSDPLIANPREFFVQHFVEALERCECIYWQGDAWHASELGASLLATHLADVRDDAPETFAVPDTLPAETQGVNW